MEKKADYGGERIITATELKSNLGKYLEEAIRMNETVITKNGSKVARLTPYVQDFTGCLQAKEHAAHYSHKAVSYEEFLRISEASDFRMEYINGEIIMQASPNSFHQDAIARSSWRLSM